MQIICVKAGATNRPNLGYLKPLWVINNETGEWEVANNETFPCQTQRVFVTAGYEIIDASFSESTFFSISIHPNQQQQNQESDFYCNYIAFGETKPGVPSAKRLEDKELISILEVALPDPNQCQISTGTYEPNTHYVTLLENGTLFGIFEQISMTDDLGFVTSKLKLINTPLLTQEKYSRVILRIKFENIPKHNILEVYINGEQRKYLHNVIELVRKGSFERQEYLSNEDILKFGGELLEKTSPQVFKKSQIQLYQKNISAVTKYASFRPLLDKFFKVVSDVDEVSADNLEWMEKTFSSEQGRGVLAKIFEHHPEILAEYSKAEYARRNDEIEKKIEKHNIRQRELEAKVRETESHIANLNRDLQLIESKKDTVNAGEIESLKARLDSEILEKKFQLEQIENDISIRMLKLKDVHKVENLDTLIAERTLIRKHIDQEIKDMNERNAKARQELAAPEYELKKKLFDMKPYVETLTGFTPEQEENHRTFKTNTTKITKDNKASLDSRDELIDNLSGFFVKEGRHYSRQDITNFLICTQQSFVVVVAGLPGVGKTSLVRLLGEGLGIDSRLLEISVGRGWTSSRDLIGYFNPLTAKFQGAQTGFYDFIKQTDSDLYQEDANAIVLLDEANLSPIEHYWSSFMGMSDNPNRGSLRIGNDTFNVSKNIRFVATINYDNTTEPLSQRMIDRAPVLVLNGTQNATQSQSEEVRQNDFKVHTSETMESWFGAPTDDLSLTLTDSRSIEEIIQVCMSFNASHGKPIALSPRKINAIKNYCRRAYPILRTERDNLALDYAISQHVLPLIDGQGEAFRNRLLALHNVLEKSRLEMSIGSLSRVIEFGKQDLDSYNFFSW